MIGSYHVAGFTVEAYFPEVDGSDKWTIAVVRDGQVVAEFVTRIATDSVYGMDYRTMALLDAAADAAVEQVLCEGAHRTGDVLLAVAA